MNAFVYASDVCHSNYDDNISLYYAMRQVKINRCSSKI